MTKQLRLGTFALLLGAFVLNACSPHDPFIPEDSQYLSRCSVQQIPVEELTEIGEPGCDMAGSVVIFPDEYYFGINEIGVTTSQSYLPQNADLSYEYGVINFGSAGVVATRKLANQEKEFWVSTQKALELYEYSE